MKPTHLQSAWTTAAVLLASAFAASLTAQNGPSPDRVTAPTTAAGVASLPSPDDDWLLPIHTQAADPRFGEYGTWASGPDYKVSFDRGFTFYPVLGEAWPENLPFRWRTARIAVGENVLVEAETPAEAVASDWRYELHYPGVVEAYDVRRDGVEQTFTLPSRPRAHGDLVVTGSIRTPLACDAVDGAWSHRALRFADSAGQPILTYGRAWAIDADGERLDLETTFDRGTIRMRVPAAWLETAVFPLTIDPLTSRTLLQQGSPSSPVRSPGIARDDLANQLMITKTRAVSQSDFDATARLRRDNWNFRADVFSDLSATWSTPFMSVAFVRGSARWVLALQRDFVNASAVRVYSHASDDPTLNGGVLYFPNPPVGFSDRAPSVGGRDSIAIGTNALLAFVREPSDGSGDGRVYGRTFEPTNGGFGVERNLHTMSTTNYDARWPCVTATASNTGSWVVVWQEYNRDNANDDWDVIAQRVRSGGLLGGAAVFGPDRTASLHKLRPVVAGRGGRYAVAMLLRDNTSPDDSNRGSELVMQRFDWPEGTSTTTPTEQPIRSLHSAALGTNRIFLAEVTRPIDYDSDSDSHWAVAFRDSGFLYVARCGYEGRAVEKALIQNPTGASPAAFDAGLCFDDDAQTFKVVFGTDDGELHGVVFERGPAMNRPYGTGCSGSITASNRGSDSLPHAGSEFYRLTLRNGVPSTRTFLMLSARFGNLPLPGNGCPLLLDVNPTLAVYGAGTSDTGGNLIVDVQLVDILEQADIYWQFVQIRGSQLSTSSGMHTLIR